MKITKRMIAEAVRRILLEKPLDDMPLPLSQVAKNPKAAKARVTMGLKDGDPADDKIQVKPGATFPVNKLKPSQTSMNIGKALAQALAMISGDMETGGDLGAFISSDNHIMDGHHRWVATAMVDPSKEVGGFQVAMPGIPLIKILNAITVGALGQVKGKEGTGGFEQFQEGPIRKQLEDYLKNGIGGKFPKTPEYVQSAIEKFSNQKAPERPDMPVIDPDIVKNALAVAVKKLADGEVDWNDPAAGGQKDKPQDAPPAAPPAANRKDEELIPEGIRSKWQKLLK